MNKNLFRQNLNINNNKNVHENMYAQHPTVKSHRHHEKLSAFHWRPWSDCNFSPSCTFSVWFLLIFYMTDFPKPCPEFCNCTGDPILLQRGKAWRLNGFKLFILAERWKTEEGREEAEWREYKRKIWQRTQHKHPFAQRACPAWWLAACVPVFTMFFSAVSEFRSPALVCFHSSFWGIKEAATQPQAWAKQSVDIFLAYHQDARRAASGVWHFGIQSGSCGAGTAELWNLQSAWDSRLCCTAGTRSLLPGSPGRRSTGWATKWMNIRGADQTGRLLINFEKWKQIHPHIWLKMILSCYGWFASGGSFQGSNTVIIQLFI